VRKRNAQRALRRSRAFRGHGLMFKAITGCECPLSPVVAVCLVALPFCRVGSMITHGFPALYETFIPEFKRELLRGNHMKWVWACWLMWLLPLIRILSSTLKFGSDLFPRYAPIKLWHASHVTRHESRELHTISMSSMVTTLLIFSEERKF
jgi:hypothetical protein